eukprot:COSAG06_NODE_8384_length_2189_cov_66.627622_1_plen_149_part_00
MSCRVRCVVSGGIIGLGGARDLGAELGWCDETTPSSLAAADTAAVAAGCAINLAAGCWLLAVYWLACAFAYSLALLCSAHTCCGTTHAAGTDINSVDASRDQSMLVAGDTFNLIRLFNYPAAAPRQPSKVFGGHGSHVTAVSSADVHS